jgi:hypothetical protein
MVAHGIDECTQDVQHALQEYPVEPNALVEFLVTIYGQAVDDRDDTGDPQAYEHHGTVGSPIWGSKVLEPGNDQAAQAQDAYLLQGISN